MKEYFNALDIPPKASKDEIKKMYRAKLKSIHPDFIMDKNLSYKASIETGKIIDDYKYIIDHYDDYHKEQIERENQERLAKQKREKKIVIFSLIIIAVVGLISIVYFNRGFLSNQIANYIAYNDSKLEGRTSIITIFFTIIGGIVGFWKKGFGGAIGIAILGALFGMLLAPVINTIILIMPLIIFLALIIAAIIFIRKRRHG
jgi:uncharacterized membrane protein